MYRGLCLLPLICLGCAASQRNVVDVFPPAGLASPWILEDEVWSGPFDQAAPSLGDDAEDWAGFQPTRVWIARYRHETYPASYLTIRAFAFEDAESAHLAFRFFQPLEPKRFDSGDEGYWTEIGVLFRWGRLVFDVFGPVATWNSQLQAAVLAGHLTRRMPDDLPDNPR
jgi:hypothetical protein